MLRKYTKQSGMGMNGVSEIRQDEESETWRCVARRQRQCVTQGIIIISHFRQSHFCFSACVDRSHVFRLLDEINWRKEHLIDVNEWSLMLQISLSLTYSLFLTRICSIFLGNSFRFVSFRLEIKQATRWNHLTTMGTSTLLWVSVTVHKVCTSNSHFKLLCKFVKIALNFSYTRWQQNRSYRQLSNQFSSLVRLFMPAQFSLIKSSVSLFLSVYLSVAAFPSYAMKFQIKLQ